MIYKTHFLYFRFTSDLNVCIHVESVLAVHRSPSLATLCLIIVTNDATGITGSFERLALPRQTLVIHHANKDASRDFSAEELPGGGGHQRPPRGPSG